MPDVLPPEIAALLDRVLREPHDAPAARALEAAATSADAWALVVARVGQAALSAPPNQHRELCLLLAGWYLGHLQSPEFAAACAARVLEAEPAEPRALRANVAAAIGLGDPERLRLAHEQVAHRHPSPLDRATAWIALGEMSVAAGDLPGAEEALETAVRTAPSYAPALDARARFLEGSRRLAEARDVWTDLAFLPAPPAARASVWVRVAELCEQLDDDAAAADAYRQALMLDPDHERAVRGIRRLADTTTGRQHTIELLESELEANRTERERIALRYRLAAVHETGGEPDKAAAVLEEILARAPDEARALVELQRLYQGNAAWKDLARTILRQTETTRNKDEKVALYLMAADVYAARLGANAPAIELAREALALAPGDPQALGSLASWSEDAGDLDRALSALQQCRAATPQAPRRAALWLRTAAIHARRGDASSEEEALCEAVRDDPRLRDAYDRLASLARARADAAGAARHLHRAIQLSVGLELSARLVELAALEHKDLGRAEEAAEHLLQAAALRPDDLLLAERVAQAQFEAGRPERARPALERVAESLEGRRGAHAHQVWSRLADARGAAADAWGRLAALRHAHEAEPGNPLTALALAEALFEQGDHESAAPLFERVFPQVADLDERVRLALLIAEARERAGDEVRASTWVRRAFELDAARLDTCRAMARVHRRRCEWRRAADLEEQIASAETGEARVRALLDVAALSERHLRDSGRAARAIAQVLEESEPTRPLLFQLLSLQTAAGRFREALETLDALEGIEDDPIIAARICATRARIVRDELRDVKGAAAAFERALDLDPRDAAGAFGELCAMWAEAGRDAMLATCYRRQISRLAEDPARRRTLCDELGALCRDEIGDLAGAWDAFTDARDLDPHNPTRDAILADLAERTGRHEDALALHHALASAPPSPVTSLRALRRLYGAAGDAVAASWAASALVVQDEADEEDIAAFALAREGVRAPQGLLSEHDWLERVAHPDCDPRIGKLLQIVAPAVHAARLLPGDAFALENERPLPAAVVSVLEWAPAVLGLVPPTVRACAGPGAPAGFALYPARVPFSVVGPIEILFGPTDGAFLLGHHLCRYRAEHFVVELVPDPSDLAALAVAAFRLVAVTPVPAGVSEAAVAAWSEPLARTLDGDAVARLARLRHLLDTVPDVRAFERWLRGAELTALRAGLVLSADLCAAARQARRLHAGRPALCEDAIADLVAYATSRAHLELRARLGQRTLPPRASEAPVVTARPAAATPPPLPIAARVPAAPARRASTRRATKRGAPPRPTSQATGPG